MTGNIESETMLSQHSVSAGQRYPDARQAPRYPISASAEAIEPLSGRRISGAVSVISRSGCYFRTVDTQKPEAVLHLRIDWREASFETWARVVHSIAGDGMGIAFIDTNPDQMAILLHWIGELAKAEQG
jgi:hypothetical protein